MKNIKNKEIWRNYLRYYGTPSLTDWEDNLAGVLLSDYPGSYIDRESGAVVLPGDPNSNICFIVHMDRIGVNGVNFDFREDGKVPIIQGQLDNSISLAALRTLYDLGYRFNAIFTTREEVCDAHEAVIRTALHHDWIVIDCDIDVFYEKDPWINSISLRSGDNISRYSPWLVHNFRKLADDCSIFYSHKDDWLVGTVGFVRKGAPYIDGLYLGLPILNYHSGYEIASLQSVNSYTTFIGKVIEEFGDVKEGTCKWNNWSGRILSGGVSTVYGLRGYGT